MDFGIFVSFNLLERALLDTIHIEWIWQKLANLQVYLLQM